MWSNSFIYCFVSGFWVFQRLFCTYIYIIQIWSGDFLFQPVNNDGFALNDFSMLKWSYIPRINPTWLWCITVFINCWNWFANQEIRNEEIRLFFHKGNWPSITNWLTLSSSQDFDVCCSIFWRYNIACSVLTGKTLGMLTLPSFSFHFFSHSPSFIFFENKQHIIWEISNLIKQRVDKVNLWYIIFEIVSSLFL